MTKEDLNNYQTRIDKAKDKSNIDEIIEDAKQRNNQLESSNPSATDDKNTDSETTKELDQFLTELNDISDKVDNPQQNSVADTHKMKKMVVQIIQKMLMIVLLMTETYQKRHKKYR